MANSALRRSLNKNRTVKSKENITIVQKTIKNAYIPNLFIRSQLDWINSDAQFNIALKGRRIGFSFVTAFMAVREALQGHDVTYMTFNFSASKKFIRNCSLWCKALNQIFSIKYNVKVIDERQILNHIIHFPNGAIVETVSSSPENFRDKENIILIDELAFNGTEEDKQEILKACSAIMIRGGKVFIWSTPNGEDVFYQTYLEVLSGQRPGKAFFIPFKKAVQEGMYKSILAMRGEEWNQTLENEWMQKVYDQHLGFSDEELDAIPRKIKGNQIFLKDWFSYLDVSDQELASQSMSVCYFDLASTELDKAKPTSYYSAYVQLAVIDKFIVIYDCGIVQLNGKDGNEWRKQIINGLKFGCIPVFEQEPGSGDIVMSYAREEIYRDCGVHLQSYKPTKSKMQRALPLLPFLKNRDDNEFSLVLHERLRNHQMINNLTQESHSIADWLIQFDGSDRVLVNDLVDCLSGSFDFLYREIICRY